MSEPPKPRPLKLDEAATSASSELPAFLARPDGAPVYHGFRVITETMTDGWCFVTITEYAAPEGCDFGDAFVVEPDGSQAGLVWDVGKGDPQEIRAPDDTRFGVYQVWFPRVVRTTDDLVTCFRAVQPQLQCIDRTSQKACGLAMTAAIPAWRSDRNRSLSQSELLSSAR